MARVPFALVLRGYILLVLLLGGASGGGFLANAVLQGLGALLIGFCVLRPNTDPVATKLPLGVFAIFAVVLVVLQFLPLPAFLWSLLPGREGVANGYDLLGIARPWLPVSLDPWASLASLVWLVPAAAVLMGMLRRDAPAARGVILDITVFAVVSVALSTMQRLGGTLYIYEITNVGAGVGFFSNANHQATFLLIAIALWTGSHLQRAAARGSAKTRNWVTDTALFWAVVTVLALGITSTGSLAGLGLMLLLGGVFFLSIRRDNARVQTLWAALALATVGSLVAYLALDLGSTFISAGSDESQTRLDFLAATLKATVDSLPFGTGLGTFEKIYRLYEPAASIGTTYVNHAHNDYAEFLLETGLVGLAAIAVFVRWWAGEALSLWKRGTGAVAWSAALAVGVVLLHSFVDYPLRTAAIETLVAVALALMVRPAESRGMRSNRRDHSHQQRQI